MANEKYLDYTGLTELVSKVKAYANSAASGKVDVSKTTTGITSVIHNFGSNIEIKCSYSENKYSSIEQAYDEISLKVTDTTNNKYAEIEITKNGIYVKDSNGTLLDLIQQITFDNALDGTSTQGVQNQVIYNAIQNVIAIAEGKTKNYVIHSSSGTNQDFNTTNEQVIVSENTYIFDINNTPISPTELKIGDIVSIVETTLPDRWLGNITGTSPNRNFVFYPLETKLNIDATPTQNSTNPVSSGGVYQALQGKQDTMTAITIQEVDALF